MPHQIRQFQNAVRILVDGMLADNHDQPTAHVQEDVAAVVEALVRVASDLAATHLQDHEEHGNLAAAVVQVEAEHVSGLIS